MTKPGKRRKDSDKFKAKSRWKLSGVKTLAQLAAEYKVDPNQISTWKRQLLENAEGIFSGDKKAKSQEEVTAPLFEEIGLLKMDIKWLEKIVSLPLELRRQWIKPDREYSIRRQCRLVAVSRSGFYYRPIIRIE